MDQTNAALLGILPGTTFQVDPSSAANYTGSTGAVSGTGTGQYGVKPLPGFGASPMNAFTIVWQWLNKPFTQPLSIWTTFQIVGTVLFALIVWNFILYHIRIAGEDI